MSTRTNPAKFIWIIAILLSGCQDKSTFIVNTWTVEELKYTREIPPDMQPAIDKSVSEMKRSFRLTYRANGSYTSVMNGQTLDGTWKLNSNSTVLSSRAGNDSTRNYRIIELKKNRFSFELEEGGDKVIFVMVPAP